MGLHFVGVSRALREIDEEIDYVAPLDVKVLISGEPGVGKHLAARLIHQRSQRTGPFVRINCSAVPDALLLSKLCGALEDAQGGSLFLDQVADMSPRTQSRLLRVFESGEIQRVRIITATDRSLLDRVKTGGFREDLYYRLNVIHLVIPPLRQRLEDVQPLITHFLGRFSGAPHVPRPVVSDAALATLTAYTWPGNVEQLANVMKQLVLRQDVGAIGARDLPIDIAHGPVWPGPIARRTRTRLRESQWRWSVRPERRTARPH